MAEKKLTKAEKNSADTITTQEIMSRLDITKGGISQLKHAAHSTMPKAINECSKFYLYERDPMLVWIDEQLTIRNQQQEYRGLDNKMAADFLRKAGKYWLEDHKSS